MKNGYVLIILAALGFAALPIFIKYGYNVGLTTEVMLFLRFLIASILLSFIMLVSGRKGFKLNKSSLPKLVLHGLVFFGSSYCYVLAIKHMSATVTNILLYTYPLMVVVMATMIFKEKISLVKTITLLISFLGCLMVIDIINTSTHQISMLGVLHGIGSAVFYAVYNINGQYLSKTLEPVTISTYTSVVCLLATMVVYPPVNLFAGHSFQAMWIVGLGTAIFSTIIPLFCYQKGVSLLGASQASILSNIEPVIATVLAFLILGEKLSTLQLSGAFLIILGGLLLKLDKGKQPSTLNS
ncbi:DMT family transporter [Desulfitobacterium chlororespirans]|uniref:Threonine/homoserine efflux transporter RhtA n=1 Tax=Desulfitobacterium chlororespirans DSM 11544 TaxID=1121395 RepID=A0A1M7RV66_9FIRM|nr:DMT family transporter [Desulfitobacterium chlororespirans]SHN50090.1 Threonine/homoserine efflux transporter RhtA [Desulfitobacterium chlororespirans DSM 11544]